MGIKQLKYKTKYNIIRGDLLLDKYKYTEKEQKELLKSMGILIDSREKKNKHITDWLDKNKIKYKKQKLHQGDYSFYVPASNDLNISRELHFNNDICIERKNSLEELSGNLTTKRSQFKHKLSHYKGDMLLLIENGSYKDLSEGNYNTQLSASAFVSSLHSISLEFGVPFIFIDSERTAQFLYLTFYYYLRNLIK